MAATAAEFALFLEPKLEEIWHDAFPAVESKMAKVFNIETMTKNTKHVAKMAGFGSMQNQADGDEVLFDDPIAPVSKSYNYTVRALGYKVHERLWMNDLYGEVERFERDLKDTAEDDVETAAFSILNNGFGTTNTGFDGLALFSASHTRMDGGASQGNKAATDEALSLSALHNAIITIRKWKNDRGRPRSHKPRRLIVPVDLSFTARELLRSQLHPENANNTTNVLREYGLDLLEVEYLTSTTGWFVQCDKHDLKFLWRFRPKSGMKTDFLTDTLLRKIRQAYGYGFGEWRGIFGSDGVA
jgi:hypothetical protein